MAISIEPEEQKILDSVAIPPCPRALITITEEIKKDDANFSVIVQAIMEDVSISAAVLKIVNSAAFRRANAISSIEQALSMLGMKRILSIVSAVAVRNASPANADLEEFWTTASLVASCCVLICKAMRKPALADDAYTLGLFHMAGAPVMMASFDDYSSFFHQAERDGWSLAIEKEIETYHTTHLTIGALMAQDWNLPESIVNAIYNLHYASGIFQASELDGDTLSLLAILKLARDLGHVSIQQSSTDEWREIEGQVLGYLGIGDTDLEDIREQVLADLDDQD